MKNDKNGGGISIRKRYIFKKCEKIKRARLESFTVDHLFLKTTFVIFLGFVMVKKKKKWR